MNPNSPVGVNANLQGALWMILAGGAFTIANVAVRSAALEIHPFVIVFLRSIIAVPLFAHLFLAKDFHWNPGPNFRFHVSRGILQATTAAGRSERAIRALAHKFDVACCTA